MRWACAVGLLLLPACGYRPGSLPPASPAGRTLVIDCLDLVVEPVADAAASGTAIAYRFGNRCDHGTRVDLGAVQVAGRFADGRRVNLVAYDPDRAIRPGRLDPRRTGGEVIEYQDPIDPAARPVELCLTLGGITGGGTRPPIACVTPPAGAVAEPPAAAAGEPPAAAAAEPPASATAEPPAGATEVMP